MDHRLIIAEKHSVAKDIARVLGIRNRRNGWYDGGNTRISWCVGHLVELAEPQSYDPDWRSWRLDRLPMLPPRFQLQARDQAADQWQTIQRLLQERGLQEVVNACDAGREGELIFAYVYELAGANAPVMRLWISSMTDQAIRGGFRNLRPGANFRALEDAARCRSEADWLVGLNATRAMTTHTRRGRDGELLSIGRVQTPTLALMVHREQEIRGFQPREFWQVKVRFRAEEREDRPGGEWEAIWMDPARLPRSPEEKRVKTPPGGRPPEDKPERIWDKPTAEAILQRIEGQGGVIARALHKQVRERHRLLYDLNALQQEANRRFRFSAQKTLDLAQSLYERHKVLTYPRTDSRYISTDQVPTLPGVLQALNFGPYQLFAGDALNRWPVPLGRRVVNDAEVTDHHALLPTDQDPRSRSLSLDEKRIYDLVTRRFLSVFQPDAIFATTLLDTAIGEDHFIARGRTCLSPGWQAVDPPQKKKKDKELPAVTPGESVEHVSSRLHEGRTQPPRRYNEASLLAAMERAGEALDDDELKRAMKQRGLGTPATRASIIETLLRRRYVERRGRDMVPTALGEALVQALPVEALTSARMTGEWEARLAAVADGREERSTFMGDARAFTADLVAAIKAASVDPTLEKLVVRGATPTGPPIGTCPACGGDVTPNARGWSCGGLGCGLRIPSTVARRTVSQRMAKQLLTQGLTAKVKGFRSSAGKEFSAALTFKPDNTVGFDFSVPDPSLGTCPACSTDVRRRGRVFTCDTGRGCPFVVFEEMSGKTIPESAVRELLQQGRSALLQGFQDRGGASFDGALAWQGGRIQVLRLDPREAAPSPGACPRCQQPILFRGGAWRCGACGFQLPGAFKGRSLQALEIQWLLTRGRSPRLHGFQQGGGAPLKAAIVMAADGRLSLDFNRQPGDDLPIPSGGPAPAFGRRTDCPACVERGEPQPGYIIAGRAAWGCARWQAGCVLRVPFVIAGRQLSDAEARRLFKRERATTYLKGFLDEDGAPRKRTWRVVLKPNETPNWVLQERRGGRRKKKPAGDGSGSSGGSSPPPLPEGI